MTRRPITELTVDGAYRRLQDDRHQRFEVAMNSGAPIVDNAGHLTVIGRLEYDGPRCPGCGDAVETDDAVCSECVSCVACRGAGVRQQYDGSPEECPRGCPVEDDHMGGAA